MLDLLITRLNSEIISSVHIDHDSPSDHSIILFTLTERKPKPLVSTITFRKKKHVNMDELREKIADSGVNEKVTNVQGVFNKMKVFEETITSVVDKIAPLESIRTTVRPNTDWYSEDITEAKRNRRKAERKWRKSGLEIHKQIYQKIKQETNKIIEDAQQKCVKRKLEENKGNSKGTFKIVNDMLKHSNSENKLPNATDPKELADKFSIFFTGKVENIRQQLDSDNDNVNDTSDPNISYKGSTLDILTSATEEEVKQIVNKSPTKECSLDIIPTWVIKSCIDQLVPALTLIINESISNADLPPTMKTALVTPLLKKPSLDPEVLNNYRPVSNLNFISKIIEKIVVSRIQYHLKENDLAPHFQSAYRQMHSTETALLRVHNDIIRYVDKKQCVILVLLDLSAAFDTIDQDILVSRLSSRFGIRGAALRWIAAYLTNRHQAVRIQATISSSRSTSTSQTTSDAKSQFTTLNYGVPQGSVLGPILFTMYTAPLSDIISEHGIQHHLYADDTQLYAPINDDTKHETLLQIQKCCNNIKHWMTTNKLKLNDAKTEVILFGTDYTRKHLDINHLIVGDSNINIATSGSVRNLGVYLDCDLSMRTQVSKICQSAHYNIRNVGKIRKILDEDNCKIIIQSLVTNRLDYCNSLLHGISNNNIERLQKVQNKAAKLITLKKKSEHVTPILESLHWLPVHQRIKFKMLCIVFKSLNEAAPSYLSDLLCRYAPQRTLRSQGENLLITPDHRLQLADRALSIAGPKMWNGIPGHLKECPTVDSFKGQLKTELFKETYVN